MLFKAHGKRWRKARSRAEMKAASPEANMPMTAGQSEIKRADNTAPMQERCEINPEIKADPPQQPGPPQEWPRFKPEPRLSHSLGKHQFKPGQSGNPKGRPKGPRAKLAERFLADILEDWELYGPATITEVRETKPDVYFKIVASLLPKDLNLNTEPLGDATDAELERMLEQLRAEIAAEGSDPESDGGDGKTQHSDVRSQALGSRVVAAVLMEHGGRRTDEIVQRRRRSPKTSVIKL